MFLTKFENVCGAFLTNFENVVVITDMIVANLTVLVLTAGIMIW